MSWAVRLRAVKGSTVSSRWLTSTARLCQIKPTDPDTWDVEYAAAYSPAWMRPTDTFPRRHIGPSDQAIQDMLKVTGLQSLDEIAEKIVPENIRLHQAPNLGEPLSEYEVGLKLREMADKNEIYRSFIGMGYYNTLLPNAIKRNILENPGWYTPYTPYQAEVAQGRLESLVNFQTMVQDLTGLDVANSSLLDEATAGAEAFGMCYSIKNGKRTKIFVDEKLHPQTISVIRTRAEPVGVEVVVGNYKSFEFDKNTCGVIFQYPNTEGCINDYEDLVERAHSAGALAACATDLLALTVLKPPGEFGCDIAFGSAQRFGIPLGFGGPHAAFISTNQKYIRKMPGRISGVTVDKDGHTAYRLTLQTRETHIRREKATSNICTAQALLANMSAMYAIYHGPDGLREIADRIRKMTTNLAEVIEALGHTVSSGPYFDTFTVIPKDLDAVRAAAEGQKINLRYFEDGRIGISLDEVTTITDLNDLAQAFADNQQLEKSLFKLLLTEPTVDYGKFERKSAYLTHPIFNTLHSETELMRYCKQLENKDVSLTHSMMPLGSCTMKLNSATEMQALTWPEFTDLHPFVPQSQAKGYYELFQDLRTSLCDITGYDAVSLQPNSGAQGEYAGLMAIREYLIANGEGHRHVCLIPVSAHGTNPASAAMCGMSIVPVKVKRNGDIDMEDLNEKCQKHSSDLAAIMITYPSTYGVFDEKVKDICDLVHEHGGQVYLDGANMNAQSMLCRPGDYGADVSHLNLHKTFCIPHGGGGPGLGPIGVKAHLAPYLPDHCIVSAPQNGRAGQMAASPFGSSLISTISWAYIKMMGTDGLAKASSVAILAANYMAARLAPYYRVTFKGHSGYVAHEFIIDLSEFKKYGVDCTDVAKRLQDYGFHSPTMSWPVNNSLMIEPTESESKEELDRYIDALVSIREEIQEIIDGKYSQHDNVLVNSPHSLRSVLGQEWNHSYTRDKAAYPRSWLRNRKFFPTVSRVDDAYGDKNIVCSCPPMETYF